MTSVLLTGGSGRLGTELRKISKIFFAPPHGMFDITKMNDAPAAVDMVVHAAGFTDVVGAETNKLACFDLNVRGTLNLLNAYPKTPFVFISSEYAHKPVNFYSLTKSLAEQLVMDHPNYLIIRTLFKPRPFPYPKAFIDQFTLGDYVDTIAERIMKEINAWDGKSKTVYVGTGRKTIFDLAKQTRPDVEPISVHDIKGAKLPQDYK